MADPISVLAVAGLIYACRTLSDKSKPPQVAPRVVEPGQDIGLSQEPMIYTESMFESRVQVPAKREVESFADIGMQH